MLTAGARLGNTVKAIISQAPSLDGMTNLMLIMKQRGLVTSVRMVFMGMTDMCRGLFGLNPAYVPMFGRERHGFAILELSPDEVHGPISVFSCVLGVLFACFYGLRMYMISAYSES